MNITAITEVDLEVAIAVVTAEYTATLAETYRDWETGNDIVTGKQEMIS